jgi:hypothetical protein
MSGYLALTDDRIDRIVIRDVSLRVQVLANRTYYPYLHLVRTGEGSFSAYVVHRNGSEYYANTITVAEARLLAE